MEESKGGDSDSDNDVMVASMGVSLASHVDGPSTAAATASATITTAAHDPVPSTASPVSAAAASASDAALGGGSSNRSVGAHAVTAASGDVGAAADISASATASAAAEDSFVASLECADSLYDDTKLDDSERVLNTLLASVGDDRPRRADITWRLGRLKYKRGAIALVRVVPNLLLALN